MSEDRADAKAREWLVEKWQPDLEPKVRSLAALLREVEGEAYARGYRDGMLPTDWSSK